MNHDLKLQDLVLVKRSLGQCRTDPRLNRFPCPVLQFHGRKEPSAAALSKFQVEWPQELLHLLVLLLLEQFRTWGLY